MPELPEVETIARQIREEYLGLRIVSVSGIDTRIFQNTGWKKISEELSGKILSNVQRYGKFLIWNVEDFFLVFHLGMSGIFIKNKEQSNYPQHIHLSVKFENDQNLYFQDIRKFSKIYLYAQEPLFTNLGVDPTQTNFTLNKFKKLLNLKAVIVKNFLMDQHVIAGIGNIYANEILFKAGINPLRKTNTISDNDAENLYHAILGILNNAIDNYGTTYSAYRTINGNGGENQYFLKVYQKQNQPCEKCGKEINRMIINNRSTFYCENCQK